MKPRRGHLLPDNASPRGEGACSRSAAQQSQNRAMRFAWRNAGACCAGQREQGPSPQGLVSNQISRPTPPTVGASLLAKASGQLASMLNVPPSLRASPLPHRAAVNKASATTPIPCGSGLARDENDTVPAQDTPPRIIKKPAPTYPLY